MSTRLSPIVTVALQTIATATLSVETKGEGFVEITREAKQFVADAGAQNGALFVYLRHTSASLTIQENADSDVQTDLTTALHRLAPEDTGWVHTVEGPDDMPSHVKAMLTGVSLHIPVVDGALTLGTWQGIFLFEHRQAGHRRKIVVTVMGE
jgi:secondary thiamine-phosphate synthase enzyme